MKRIPLRNLEGLLEWATPGQAKVIKALIKYQDIQEAADHLKVSTHTVRSQMSYARKRAAAKGWSPDHGMVHTVPEGFNVKGVSTLYDGEGNVSSQWVKTERAREEMLELMSQAFETICDPFRGKSVKVRAPRKVDKDLLSVYPMGDPHLGMLSWEEETGTQFNLEIAEEQLFQAVDSLVDLAPPSEEALIINLGDFLHTDSVYNTTMRSKHPLDVSDRWPKILQVALRTMRRIIDRAKEKHKIVRVENAIGNHDDHSSLMLSLGLSLYYENDKRVIVNTAPDVYHWQRFGACLIGVTHGNGAKPAELPGIMATDKPKDWGETRHRYWYTGHIHHDTVKEYPGCIVETFRTLAPRDSWAHNAGYRSGRDMKCDILHREYGRINRHIIGIEQIVAKSTGD